MTTNDKPVCYQLRLKRPVIGEWSGWAEYADAADRDEAALFLSLGCEVETRDLYARPQPAAPQVPEGWSGWATQYPGKMPKLYGAEEVARLNWHPSEGQDLVQVAEIDRVSAREWAENSATPPAPAPEQPKPEWRCFQCGEVFTDSEAAALHFGTREHQSPACCIDIAEYRRMEAKEVAYAAEDSEIHHTLYAMRTQHAVELRRAEEAGYAKGLRDAEAEQPKPAGDVEALDFDAFERLIGAARNRIHKAPKSHGEQWRQGARTAINFIELHGSRVLARLAAQPAQGEGEK